MFRCCTLKYLCQFLRLYIAIALCIPAVVQAQERSLSEHEKMLKQGMDRLEHNIAPLRERADVQLQRPDSFITDFSQPDSTDQCFDIRHINIEGITKLASHDTELVIAPFLQQCIGLAHINALISALSNLYLEAGYVTSRAYIAPQDLSDGTLDIIVIEGFIEEILNSDNSLGQRQLRWAFPVSAGDMLNIRDLEQGIENLNSLAQNNAAVKLNPGAEQGGSQVIIENQQSSAWRGSVGFNNHGVASTGEYQLDANLVFDNLFGINDSGFISASTNVGEHELPDVKSRSYAMSWSFPAGYWHFSLFNNYYAYEQTIIGNVIDFSISGSSLNNGVQVARNVLRNQTQKLDISAGFTRKDSKNYIENVFLETSSRTLYLWEISASYRHFLPAGTLSVNTHIHKSVPWFDAKKQLVAAEDSFQFTKYQLAVGFNTDFELAGQSFSYAATADFLYSPKAIVASEALTVGGRYSVRGLSQSSLFGYKGGYLRNDVVLPLQTSWPMLYQVQYFLGVDAGWSDLPEYPEQHTEWVMGSVAGLKLYDRNLSITLSYARALRVPDFLPQKQQEIDFSVRLSF